MAINVTSHAAYLYTALLQLFMMSYKLLEKSLFFQLMPFCVAGDVAIIMYTFVRNSVLYFFYISLPENYMYHDIDNNLLLSAKLFLFKCLLMCNGRFITASQHKDTFFCFQHRPRYSVNYA